MIRKFSSSFNRKIYNVGDKFGRKGYRGNIPAVEKRGLAIWLAISIIGRLISIAWVIQLIIGKGGPFHGAYLLGVGLLMWGLGEFYFRACHRGILYHHMDFLAEYLEGLIHKQHAPNKPLQPDGRISNAAQAVPDESE